MFIVLVSIESLYLAEVYQLKEIKIQNSVSIEFFMIDCFPPRLRIAYFVRVDEMR